jgi:tetratricopeptide (TPR) repeat protein
MFIIPPYIRIALIVLGIVGGIALWAAFGFWYGFFFVLTGVILLLGLIFLGTVGPAAQALQDSDFDKAEKMLNLTPNPNWLYSTNKAYFYMLKGSIAIARKDVNEGERYLKMAEAVEVPSDNERAMLQIQLAQIALSKQRFQEAKIHYKKAKGLKISEGPLKDQFRQLEQAINQSGQMKAAMRQGRAGHGMSGGKGKRRRPKMR